MFVWIYAELIIQTSNVKQRSNNKMEKYDIHSKAFFSEQGELWSYIGTYDNDTW